MLFINLSVSKPVLGKGLFRQLNKCEISLCLKKNEPLFCLSPSWCILCQGGGVMIACFYLLFLTNFHGEYIIFGGWCLEDRFSLLISSYGVLEMEKS